MIDKNEAIINFLLTCPTIVSHRVYFNFADENAMENSSHIITEKDTVIKRYIDGSSLKSYTFTVAMYLSADFIPVKASDASTDGNLEDMSLVQEVLDWINEQGENYNFPNFGSDYTIDEMQTLKNNPSIDGIDTSVNPPIVRYSIGVNIQYLDRTKVLWN